MRLLPAVSFMVTVSSAMDELREIAKIMSNHQGEENSKEFLEACERVDYAAANEILDRFVMRLTKCSSVDDALIYFAGKFDLFDKVCKEDGLTAKVKAINEHYDEIKQKLSARKR